MSREEYNKYLIHKNFVGYCDTNNMDMVKNILMNHNIAMQTPPPHNYSYKHPICRAAYGGHLDLVKYLLKYCKDKGEPYDLEKYIIDVVYDAWIGKYSVDIVRYIITIYNEYTGKELHRNTVAYVHTDVPLGNERNIFTMFFYKICIYGDYNEYDMAKTNELLYWIYDIAYDTKTFVDFNYSNTIIFHNACLQGNLDLVKFMIKMTSFKYLYYEPIPHSQAIKLHKKFSSRMKRIKIHHEGKAFGNACVSGNLELVKYLLDIPIKYSSKKFNINAMFKARDNRLTPFSGAIYKGHIHIAKYLVEIAQSYYNKDINIFKDTHILAYAKRFNNIDIMRWLLDLSLGKDKKYDFNIGYLRSPDPIFFRDMLKLYIEYNNISDQPTLSYKNWEDIITKNIIKIHMDDYNINTLRFIMNKLKRKKHIDIHYTLDITKDSDMLFRYNYHMTYYIAQCGWVCLQKGSNYYYHNEKQKPLKRYLYKKIII